MLNYNTAWERLFWYFVYSSRLKIHTIPGLSTIESLKVIKYISVVNISNKQFLSEFSDCIGEIETPKNIHHIEIKDNVTLVITLAKELITLIFTFIHISNQLFLSCLYLMLNTGRRVENLEKSLKGS